MPPKMIYPLQDVLRVKERRVETAEKVLKDKQELQRKEEEKLKAAVEARDKVKTHYQDKLKQMRDELDHGTTSDKVQQMKVYLKIVQQNLLQEDKKVKDQEAQVEVAKKNVEIARNELALKRKEVDKFVQHREDWLKGVRKEIEIDEIREHDELGNTVFLLHKRRDS